MGDATDGAGRAGCTVGVTGRAAGVATCTGGVAGGDAGFAAGTDEAGALSGGAAAGGAGFATCAGGVAGGAGFGGMGAAGATTALAACCTAFGGAGVDFLGARKWAGSAMATNPIATAAAPYVNRGRVRFARSLLRG
jgi:hypothetical protein